MFCFVCIIDNFSPQRLLISGNFNFQSVAAFSYDSELFLATCDRIRRRARVYLSASHGLKQHTTALSKTSGLASRANYPHLFLG